MAPLRFVIFGLSITSSWGNGHATTYRSLIRALAARGHRVTFIERDVPWYAENRDLAKPAFCTTLLYESVKECKDRFSREVKEADVVIVGSYVPEGVLIGTWVTNIASGVKVFYDIDTPVTLAKMAAGDDEYLSPAMIPRFDLYLSFTGGPIIQAIEKRYGAARARVLYCSVDPELYYPDPCPSQYDLGYLGTYGADRQPALESLLCDPARRWPEGRFAVAGPLYPRNLSWPPNVKRVQHLAPALHRRFYNSQRFTLNITRADMVRAGYSPSVRLFEAAACGTPIISDSWPGLETLFVPESEILIAGKTAHTLRYLREMGDQERMAIGERARQRVLASHTAAHRAAELEAYIQEVITSSSSRDVSLAV